MGLLQINLQILLTPYQRCISFSYCMSSSDQQSMFCLVTRVLRQMGSLQSLFLNSFIDTKGPVCI